MSEFEPFDDELAAALRRRARTGSTSTSAAHDAVLHRAGAIRRRRAAIGGGGAMAVLAIGGIMLLPGNADEIGPAVTGDVLPSFEEPSTTASVTVPSDEATDDPTDDTAPSIVDLSIPPVTAPTSVPAVVTLPTTTVPASAPSVTAPTSSTTRAPDTSSPTSSTPTTSAPDTSSPTSSEPAPSIEPFTKTYQSSGGSIVVNWDGSALTLQSVAPAAGFVADVETSEATRVRVRFEGSDAESRIEVRITGGQLVEIIS